MKISQVTAPDPTILDAINKLLPQLAPGAPQLQAHAFDQIVAASCCTLFVATQDARIIGSLTLIMYRIPSRIHAWIEDVVVDKSARGCGVGEALVRHAIAQARREGAAQIGLSSAPHRVNAIRLYRKIGFKERSTHVFQYPLTQELV